MVSRSVTFVLLAACDDQQEEKTGESFSGSIQSWKAGP